MPKSKRKNNDLEFPPLKLLSAQELVQEREQVQKLARSPRPLQSAPRYSKPLQSAKYAADRNLNWDACFKQMKDDDDLDKPFSRESRDWLQAQKKLLECLKGGYNDCAAMVLSLSRLEKLADLNPPLPPFHAYNWNDCFGRLKGEMENGLPRSEESDLWLHMLRIYQEHINKGYEQDKSFTEARLDAVAKLGITL
jgi:hypothetical protein